MDMLYPLQLNDIHRVEQIINKKILGEKRKKQRDRLVSMRSRDEMRRDDRRNDRRRDDKRDGRRDDKRDTRTDTAHMIRMKTPSRKMTQITSTPGSPMTEATQLGPRGTRLDHLDDRLKDEIVGTPRENASNMGLAQRAEAWATRLTFVGDGASSANKSMKAANVNSSADMKSWLPSSRITLTSPKSRKNSKISTRRASEDIVGHWSKRLGGEFYTG
ncbi:Hypothetical protein PHPALM_2960 [Phytophthora palmivora]|uniref:Uncharacterized protein n=1 Tax=Phytophthora palmivora TaxID=4796 RepID=A0A2P4YNL3_9STRA|nr:Hypothetical protein PHPALM_2960 [Phytophthora palmivora]